MSGRRDNPERTWSNDSQSLPAGIRHVPRRDIPAQEQQEERPVRPWQRGERPRERQAQHVRFQDPFDDQHSHGARWATRAYHGHEHHPTDPSRPVRLSARSSSDRLGREELRQELELERVRGELDRLKAREERLLARRRKGSTYETRSYRSGSRSPPEPGLTRRGTDGSARSFHRSESLQEERRGGSSYSRPARRARSTSPQERVIRADLYSDPESYDAEPATGESSGYELPPHARPPRSPDLSGSAYSSEDNDSDRSWNSASDTSGDLYDLYNERRVYEFNPSHLSRTLSQDASTPLSGSIGEVSVAAGSGSGEKGPRSSSPDLAPGPKVARPYRIYQSEYTGDGFPHGSHSVKLTAILDSKRQRQPLFRWRHILQSTMNFDELSEEVGRIGGLADNDRHGLAKLLSDVKRYSIKSTPTSKGSNVKHMEPGLLQVRLEADSTMRMPARTATWLCIPYFTLQKYAGPLADATPGSFPTRTLLQEQYSGVSAERDMQQAVCQTGHVPPDMCFHVAQLWCIVLDDSLLITCGTVTEAALRTDLVDLVTEPSRDPSSPASPSFIYVYYTEAVMYALPTEQCRSWFAFISHFREFWPTTLKFTHRDRLVTAADWPSILNLARLSSSKVLLVLKLGGTPQLPARGVLESTVKDDDENNEKTVADESEDKSKTQNLKPPNKGKQNAAAKGSVEPEPQEDKFHVFSWLEPFTSTGEPVSQEHSGPLRMQLQEMEDFLTNDTTDLDRKTYQSCPEGTWSATLTYLEEQSATVKQNPHSRRDFEDRVDIFNAAEIIFRFFLPLDYVGPTVGKFWGAISRIVQMPKSGDGARSSYGRDARVSLRELARLIRSFANIVSHAQPFERAGIAIPIQFFRAWIHLLMALATVSRAARSWDTQIETTMALILEGMAEMTQRLPSEDLLAREVVLPMEVVCLLNLNLLQDLTGTFPSLDTVYSEYMDAMDNEVATKPSERSFEHRINLLKQEVTVINRIVGKQRRIFTAIAPSDSRLRTRPHDVAATNVNDVTGLYSTAVSKKRTVDDGDYYPTYPPPSQQRAADRAPTESYHRSADLYTHRSIQPQVPVADDDAATQPAREYYRLSPTQPGGFRDLLTTDCLALIDRRYTAFSELLPYADYLQEYNMNKWEDTKDRQEQAIYAFTVVTVIFLPLSAVAGVFGMNTADVRDMAATQWLYWATAVPVTVAVVLLGLWWMGELGNALAWLLPLRRGWARKTAAAAAAGGYAVVGGGGSGGGGGSRVYRAGVRGRRTALRVVAPRDDDGDSVLLPAVVVQGPAGGDAGSEVDVRLPSSRLGTGRRAVRRRRSGPVDYVDDYAAMESGGPVLRARYRRP